MRSINVNDHVNAGTAWKDGSKNGRRVLCTPSVSAVLQAPSLSNPSGLSHFRIADAALPDLAETPRSTDIGPDSLVTQWRASGAEPLATKPFVHRFG
ncbi:hypothetical protein AB9E06_27230 [Rhizobium leguminosarum]|uniref:hypothetical protein n=1 Tax=Rhizobium leguminosarum TaxID=384 RepID=UPI003F9A78EC